LKFSVSLVGLSGFIFTSPLSAGFGDGHAKTVPTLIVRVTNRASIQMIYFLIIMNYKFTLSKFLSLSMIAKWSTKCKFLLIFLSVFLPIDLISQNLLVTYEDLG